MDRVTEKLIRDTISERGITRWKLRSCSICGIGLYYLFDGQHVAYQSACDCGHDWYPPESRTYADVVAAFNMNTPEVRAQMWQQFLGET